MTIKYRVVPTGELRPGQMHAGFHQRESAQLCVDQGITSSLYWEAAQLPCQCNWAIVEVADLEQLVRDFFAAENAMQEARYQCGEDDPNYCSSNRCRERQTETWEAYSAAKRALMEATYGK